MKQLTAREWDKIVAAAQAQGVKRGTAWVWKYRKTVPLQMAKPLAASTGISKARLCPRVYG